MARFCTQCGFQNQDDANFCASCGTRLTPAAQPQPATPPTGPAIPLPAGKDEASLRTMTMIIYGLLAAGWITGGLLGIVAIILAYVKRDDARGSWLESHYTWLIRTFWIGLGIGVLGMLTVFVVVGFFILFGGFVWTVYRVVKGFVRLNDKLPVD